jgi:hypothetical protein
MSAKEDSRCSDEGHAILGVKGTQQGRAFNGIRAKTDMPQLIPKGSFPVRALFFCFFFFYPIPPFLL